MTRLSPNELFAPLQREHLLKAVELIDTGEQSRFVDSTKFDVLYREKRYALKELVALALEILYGKKIGTRDFKGDEGSACFKKLESLGLIIVPKIEFRQPGTLKKVVSEILRLQLSYTSFNTDDMLERGNLVRSDLKNLIHNKFEMIVPTFSSAGYSCKVEGSDGIGRKSRSPWIRIFSPELSPTPRDGWYFVIHFSSKGDYFYLTINCGSTWFHGDGSLNPISDDELAEKIRWAKAHLSKRGADLSRFQEEIALHGNSLSRQFEKATLLAKRYSPNLFIESDFWSDIRLLCSFLMCLYDGERQGKYPPVAPAEPLEMIDMESAVNPLKKGVGQGRGMSYPERRAVELRAMAVAEAQLVSCGYTKIVDTSAHEPYDFKAKKDGGEWLIEVKGSTSNQIDSFLLTANELSLHQSRQGSTVLIIVSGIELSREGDEPKASGGVAELHTPWDVSKWDFLPTAYVARRRKEA
ncbi:MrcB family domain-containing protein [Pseudomonas nitroreducens]|uniref:MrcB family domain-containing protein n=1 Tax=Pseudomonas nitroreducens TaxID=46680 RepID=UPI0018762039|nr:DUF3578 domain-containing protein [Pseudomonas nitritireducens]